LGFKLGNWSDEIDFKHQGQLEDVQFHYLSATRDPLLPWFKSTIINLLCRKVFGLHSGSAEVNAFGSDKRSFLLWQLLKNTQTHFDIFVAHNLGALYPAWKLSKKHKIPFVFDIEDYHPGEKCSGNTEHEQKRREWLLKNLLPEAALVTYASPLIGEHSVRLIGENNIKKHLLINNSFHSSEFENKKMPLSPKLKFIWFSQNIDQGRGLEDILPVLDEFYDRIELHLIGNVRAQFNNEYLKNRDYIRLHGTMPQSKLHALLSSFDIGLAIEPGKDLNNILAVSNKIYAYSQSGLYILATGTEAQRQFISERPWAGEILTSTERSMKETIAWLIDNLQWIRKEASDRSKKAKDFAWEKEGERLHTEIKQILNA
jgi:glycosyltransferase involved in cell wall biosynthesis